MKCSRTIQEIDLKAIEHGKYETITGWVLFSRFMGRNGYSGYWSHCLAESLAKCIWIRSSVLNDFTTRAVINTAVFNVPS